jgi:hypothetical protein
MALIKGSKRPASLYIKRILKDVDLIRHPLV